MIFGKYSEMAACLALVLLISLANTQVNAQTGVQIWEEKLKIPTYMVGQPDKNPRFYSGRAYQGAQGRVYPYPMLDTLTDQRKDIEYNAVYLENEYIKICVLPEMGGRLFSAIDKTNNYDFIYRQNVIKPALIGMLGAWISGGIEWCVPHHHRATTFMTVDYNLLSNPDGSKTVFVGEIELRHRMKWFVALTLYPGKSYIEATVKVFNRTPFVHSMLYWANVAVHANEQYQVLFPPSTEYATYHGKNQFSQWPLSRRKYAGNDYTAGVDISWWKNHPAPISFFAWNYRDDFFGGYDHGKKAGTAYVANHNIAPGKKLWEWGPSPRGRMWDKILTDTDGPYIEIMAGAYSDNQPDYSWIQPGEAKIVKQYWYPIRKMPGLKNANGNAAVNLHFPAPDIAAIALNTTSRYENAQVRLNVGEKNIYRKRIAIDPVTPFSAEVKLKEGMAYKDIKVELLTVGNEEIISYSPVQKAGDPMPEPVKPPTAPEDIQTVEELYLTGLRLDQFYHASMKPYPYYEEALKRDPNNALVNTELGILYCKRGMFAEAQRRLEKAVQRLTKNYTRPKDGRPYYYLGLALKFQEKYDEAYDAFYKATWSYPVHAAAYCQLAQIDCIRGNFQIALEHINRAVATNIWYSRAWNLKSAIFRHLGQFDLAMQVASETLSFDPLNFLAAYELHLAQTAARHGKDAKETLAKLESRIRGQLQPVLEIAVDYANCGMWQEAITVLDDLTDVKKKRSTTNPMAFYYFGYFLEKSGKPGTGSTYYRQAAKAAPDYCFPFRIEAIAVLNAALKSNPADGHAAYYFGNLLYDNQPKEAIKAWEMAARLLGTFPTVHRNLAFAYAKVNQNIPKAIASLEHALNYDKADARLFYELDLLYEAAGHAPAKRLDLLQNNIQTVLKRDDAVSQLITLYIRTTQYDKAIDLLTTRHFHTWEGGGRIHDTYVDAYLLRGKSKAGLGKHAEALEDYQAALLYPENLEVGKPNKDKGLCRIDFFLGTAQEALNNAEKAKEYYEKAASAKLAPSSHLSYYKGRALSKIGRDEEATKIFDQMIASAETDDDRKFFAKFGEKQAKNLRQAQKHYRLALAYMGKGDSINAKQQFAKTLQLNINHLWVTTYLADLNANN
ncbi:MAG: DUF5107 domain-containing protein [Planctomycetota bacterium]|jgi:tetratricopeptide (TPR) repeat protein